MFGINLNSVLPMRSQPEEQSEMVTQLLFGEHFRMIAYQGNFSFVENLHDGYQGWIDTKMITPVDIDFGQRIQYDNIAVINKPVANCYIESKEENIILPGGSCLPFYNPQTESCTVNGETFHVSQEQVNLPKTKKYSGDDLLSTALMYLNSPYLWGGRNVLGIDCSGLVQVAMNICGQNFPRNASQQVEKGELVSFLIEARGGDLAFFENAEGRITHVGILINNHKILHASGYVKIETIDAQGIINKQSGRYSHQLRVIKRVL